MIRQLIFTVFLLFFWAASFFAFSYYYFYHRPLVAKNISATVTVAPGAQFSQVVETLKEKKLIKHPWFFTKMAERLYGDRHLHYGRYRVDHKMSASMLLHHMMNGEGMVQYRVTLVDGWQYKRIRDELARDPNLRKTSGNMGSQAVMQRLGGHWPSVEGWLFPDTYFFTWGNTDFSVVKTAFEKMQRVIQQLWKNRAPHLPYKTPYSALIAASLIQREAALQKEKPLVASVIVKRLKKGMRLQIDPTVQYGLGKSFGSVITKSDLEHVNAYNTYLKRGLPPTPICMPGEASIHAALHPAKTGFLYYVADGLGGHYFSATYKEHKKAVKRYRHFKKQLDQETKAVEGYLHHGSVVARRIDAVVHILQF